MKNPLIPRLAGALLVLAVLGACSTTAPRTTLPRGGPLAIEVRAVPTGDGPIPISNQAMGKDIGTGATSGGVSGGVLGLACGPLALICMPVFAGLGALTGTAAGAIVGATGSLSDAQTTQVRERLARLRRSHDLLVELRERLTDGAGRHWQLTSDANASKLSVELEELWLGSTRDERIGFVIRVAVKVSPTGGVAPPLVVQGQPGVNVTRTSTRTSSAAEKVYEYVSPLTPLSVWVDDQSDFLDATFSAGLQQLTSQIVMDLVPG
jgi:hypothetical protein